MQVEYGNSTCSCTHFPEVGGYQWLSGIAMSNWPLTGEQQDISLSPPRQERTLSKSLFQRQLRTVHTRCYPGKLQVFLLLVDFHLHLLLSNWKLGHLSSISRSFFTLVPGIMGLSDIFTSTVILGKHSLPLLTLHPPPASMSSWASPESYHAICVRARVLARENER